MSTILQKISQKQDVDQLVKYVIKNPDEVEMLINEIRTNPKAIKFACEKILRKISEEKPELIYPYFDFFAELLDHDNSFLKWGGIITIANLAKVDKGNKIEKIFDKYFRLITDPAMITASNTIGHSWKIAEAKPELADEIVDRILKLESVNYIHKGKVSPECKSIVRGNAIEAFGKIFHLTTKKKEIINFVENQLDNKRPKVREQALQFMREIVKGTSL